VRRAVADVVRQQVDAGIDVVNDVEQSKVGYSTCVRHRRTGFGGRSAGRPRADWADFPEAAARAERRSTVSRPACNGPIDWKDRTAVEKDATKLRAGLNGVPAAHAFMTAASPGVIAHFRLARFRHRCVLLSPVLIGRSLVAVIDHALWTQRWAKT
jgi:5-methyltetrahydropteroyltriglutamate--homocysteine methyltransferase